MEDPMIMKDMVPPKRWRLPWRRPRSKPLLKSEAQAGFIGLEETHRPEEEALFDLICVHGLGGSPKATWETIDTELWPGPSLANQLPKCRMLVYGYKISEEALLKTSLKNNINDLAAKLLQDVDKDREDSPPKWNPRRPIVFVAHGLGGLICQHAATFINRSEHLTKINSEHLTKTAQLVHGVILLATPHSRAGLAQWAAISARSMDLTKKAIVDIRKKFEDDMDSIVERQRSFREMIAAVDLASETSERGRIKAISCFEARQPWKDAKTGISPEFAITPYSKAIQAHGISDEHRGLANFKVEGGDSGFGVLAKELSKWSQQMESDIDKLSKDSMENEEKPTAKVFPYQERHSHSTPILLLQNGGQDM